MVRVEADVERGVAGRVRGRSETAVAFDPKSGIGSGTTGERDWDAGDVVEPVDHYRIRRTWLVAKERDDHPTSRRGLKATSLDLTLDSRVLTGPEGRRPYWVEEVVHEI